MATCATVSCNAAEACYDGVCQPDGCTLLDCEAGFACFDGACVRDLCIGVECSDGEACLRGRCEVSPCNGVECPRGQACFLRQETAQCAFAGVDQPESEATHNLPQEGSGGPPDYGIEPLPTPPPGEPGAPIEREQEPAAAEAGCDCDVGGGRSMPVSAMMFLLLVTGVRRLRRSVS